MRVTAGLSPVKGGVTITAINIDRWQNLRGSKLYCQWRHGCGPQAGQIYVYGGDGYATFTGDKPAVTRIAQD